MNKVYIVYYDNGADYAEDSEVRVSRVFANKQDAEEYKEDGNKRLANNGHPFDWKASFFIAETDVY